jgi:hypothetical protein
MQSRELTNVDVRISFSMHEDINKLNDFNGF